MSTCEVGSIARFPQLHSTVYKRFVAMYGLHLLDNNSDVDEIVMASEELTGDFPSAQRSREEPANQSGARLETESAKGAC